MRKIKKSELKAIFERGYKNYLRSVKRTKTKRRLRRGETIFLAAARAKRIEKGESFYFGAKKYSRLNAGSKPAYPELSSFFFKQAHAFSTEKVNWQCKGKINIPTVFSLTRAPEESYKTIKNLLFLLYKGRYSTLTLDYGNCLEIDVDASVCMDIIIMEYNLFLKECQKKGYAPVMRYLKPVNFNRPEIKEILFSIGAIRNVRGLKINYPGMICYNLCIRNKKQRHDSGVDITRIVDYVQDCLHKMQKQPLTIDARKKLCDVVGEILINAEEHSTTSYSFSIGYFKEYTTSAAHNGLFNLVIMNFGETMYEKFKSPECQNRAIVDRMKELSGIYVKKNFFGKAEFTEETLWTLYALQEGITSVPAEKFKKRGNGSIRFIESFFDLKGTGTQMDDVSKMTILSGNSKIVFDGTHEIVNKVKGGSNFKIMAFNEKGDIEEKPDKKYVTFVDNYFPGTLISAKILISDDDIQKAAS